MTAQTALCFLNIYTVHQSDYHLVIRASGKHLNASSLPSASKCGKNGSWWEVMWYLLTFKVSFNSFRMWRSMNIENIFHGVTFTKCSSLGQNLKSGCEFKAKNDIGKPISYHVLHMFLPYGWVSFLVNCSLWNGELGLKKKKKDNKNLANLWFHHQVKAHLATVLPKRNVNLRQH